MHRHALSDAQWKQIEPLLPRRPQGRKSTRGDRLFLDAVLFRAKTGMPWRDLPERFGPWKSVYNRFANWAAKDHWAAIFRELQLEFDPLASIVDGSVVRADQDASGGKGGSNEMLWAILAEVQAPRNRRRRVAADLPRADPADSATRWWSPRSCWTTHAVTPSSVTPGTTPTTSAARSAPETWSQSSTPSRTGKSPSPRSQALPQALPRRGLLPQPQTLPRRCHALREDRAQLPGACARGLRLALAAASNLKRRTPIRARCSRCPRHDCVLRQRHAVCAEARDPMGSSRGASAPKARREAAPPRTKGLSEAKVRNFWAVPNRDSP